MKLQKCTIAIHPVIATVKPDILVKLMTLDHYCYPIKGLTGKEAGPRCTLYFKKSLSKDKLRRLKELNYSGGLFVSFSNTYDNPCLIQNGHDPSYAVHLFKLEEIYNILKEIIQTLNNRNYECI